MGKPDFVFRRERLAVLVDGCFWHGCPKHANMPANNRAFWKKKLTGNKVRDKVVSRALRKDGWTVIRIWEHELVGNPGRCLRRIRQAMIHGTAMYPTTRQRPFDRLRVTNQERRIRRVAGTRQ
jgi:DNA mismatch endonuclease (patch repair protein)